MQTINIPMGTVSRLRAVFEQKISEHHYECDELYARRAMEAQDRLVEDNMTYTQQLRAVESLTLFHLPEHLVAFIRNHDNFYRATIRGRKRAQDAKSAMTNIDTLTRFVYRIRSLRNSLALDVLNDESTNLMQHNPDVEDEFNHLAYLFERVIMSALIRLDLLMQEISRESDLENVGSDHDINDFGQAIPPHRMHLQETEEILDKRDHSVLCCICLGQYDDIGHSAFRLNICNHIIGKACMEAWMNSTSTNSTLCPHCRAQICTRRPRRPKVSDTTTAVSDECIRLQMYIMRAVGVAQQASDIFFEVYGGGDNANRVGYRDGDWLNELINRLNRRLAIARVNYSFLLRWSDVGSGLIWRLQRTD